MKLKAEKLVLRKIKRRRFCAYWLIPKAVLRSLLRKRLVVPTGFYSVALPGTQEWTMISYAKPEKAFDTLAEAKEYFREPVPNQEDTHVS